MVLVVDQSASIRGAAQAHAEKFVEQIRELDGSQRVAVLPFAGRPGELKEVPAAGTNDHAAVDSAQPAAIHPGDKPHGSPRNAGDESSQTPLGSVDLDRQASNPARALLAAAAQAPPEFVCEIVLLTDGAQTDGDLQKGAVGAGMPISVVPLASLAGPEVCLAELTAPAYAVPRDDFEIDAVIESNQADAGTVTLVCAGQSVAERHVELKAGRNVVALRPIMPAAERVVFVAELRGFQDTTVENNRRSAIVYATDRPRVLILAADAPAAGRFAALLDSQGFDAKALAPADWEKSLPPLDRFGVLVLLDVPVAQLPEAIQRLDRTFAREGCGVLAIGGSATFASAVFRHTVLEEILPVSACPTSSPGSPAWRLCW